MKTITLGLVLFTLSSISVYADVDSVLQRMTTWSDNHPARHVTITSTQAGSTTTQDVYVLVSSGTQTFRAYISSDIPKTYNFTLRSLSNGATVAIFPVTGKKVYVTSSGQADSVRNSLGLAAPGDPDAYKNIKNLSTSSSATANANGTDTIAFALNVSALVSAGVAPPFSGNITISIVVDSAGKILSLTQSSSSAPSVVNTYSYVSTDATTVGNYLSGLTPINTNEIDTNLNFEEALEAELAAIN